MPTLMISDLGGPYRCEHDRFCVATYTRFVSSGLLANSGCAAVSLVSFIMPLGAMSVGSRGFPDAVARHISL